jgi:hypothetical protein
MKYKNLLLMFSIIGLLIFLVGGFANLASANGDFDGIPDYRDNCPTVYNPDQADLDGDGLGDVCDPDDDNDGISDEFDNCPLIANSDQVDADGDSIGNACDPVNDLPDADGDGVLDVNDNCPLVPNKDQLDTDGDGAGDVCDQDDDNDGLVDGEDPHPLEVRPRDLVMVASYDVEEYTTYPVRKEVSKILQMVLRHLAKAEATLLSLEDVGEKINKGRYRGLCMLARAQIRVSISVLKHLERMIPHYEELDIETANSLKSMDLHDICEVLKSALDML